MNRDIAKEKLKKIRQLAERGTGGEKEQARKTYEKLLKKYEIADEEVADEVQLRWFRFKTETEEYLLKQIFYAVTGDCDAYCWRGRSSRKKERGVYCTEAEAAEIDLLFSFYREQLRKELKPFMIAFANKNRLFPDPAARMYDHKKNSGHTITPEEKNMMRKAALMAISMDGKKPPRGLLEKRTMQGL